MTSRRTIGILCALILVCADVGAAQEPAQEAKVCKSCDCAHWPWPNECHQCCGVFKGTILSSEKNRIVVGNDGEKRTFRITPRTKLPVPAEKGKNVEVYYRRGAQENLGTPSTAVAVTVEHGTSKLETGPITQGPGSALSINQQGGVTVGTLVVPEPPLPHVRWSSQQLEDGQTLFTFVRYYTRIGGETEETTKLKEQLRKNPGVLITASLSSSLTGATFVAECENPCVTVDAMTTQVASQVISQGKGNLAIASFLTPSTMPAGIDIKWEVKSLRDEPVKVKAVKAEKAF